MEIDLKQFERPPAWAETHPVAHVYWIPIERIEANDYNPNVVAPPEMRLLELSIDADGYTQPLVVWLREDGIFEVVDGFHRFLVGKERAMTHLPCVVINQHVGNRNDRIAATIRHNRARGKHQIAEMSRIVLELKRRNWSDQKIGRELGMDSDEVLRLCQIGGLADIFADREFSEAWK